MINVLRGKIINFLIIIILGMQFFIYLFNQNPLTENFSQKKITVENFSSIVLSKSGINKIGSEKLNKIDDNNIFLEGESYLENKEYKIVSINPADIIGADQLWVFNTKYRMLKKFQAMGPSGLSVKGTTLQGYNPDESIQKKLRKPDEILPQVLSGGKRVMKKLMGEINSKESPISNGRINGDTILLRVLAR